MRIKHTCVSIFISLSAQKVQSLMESGQAARLPTSFLQSFFFLGKKKVDNINNHLSLQKRYDKREFRRFISGAVVGVDLPGDPNKMKNLHKILSTNVCNPTCLQHRFFMYSGSPRTSTPTNNPECITVNIHLSSSIPRTDTKKDFH